MVSSGISVAAIGGTLDAVASHTDRGCHVTVTWCPSLSAVCDNKLADVAANERIAVEQEGENRHYDSAKAAIRQATKEPPSSHEECTMKEARKLTTSWKPISCQGRTKSPSAD